ncbi:hypothetical protein ACIGCP_11985 [Cellulophaga baltica]|uniref:hypothetical protein n=1 Tax=Cellulophaga baltica TaxID=76594 RepID=UPI0037CB5AF5
MKKLVFVFLPLLFLVFACSKKSSEVEEPIEEEIIAQEIETYFTLNVPENKFSDITEAWVVLHDPNNNNVLDYQRLTNGTTYTFEKLKSDFFIASNISLLSIATDNGNTSLYISTYTFIDNGTEWTLDSPTAPKFTPRENPTGALVIKANNLISPASYNVSNSFGSTLSGGASISTVDQQTALSFDNVLFFNDNRYLLSLFDANGDGKYMFLDDLTDGQIVTLDNTQLKTFDQTVPVYIPEGGEYYSSVFGYNKGQEYSQGNGYILNLIFPFDNEKITSGTLNLGYLNTLDRYITTFNYTKDKFNYSYKKYGEIPTRIFIGYPEEWNVEVTNESIHNFQFSGPSTNLFYTQSHHWQTSSGTKDVDYSEIHWAVIHRGDYYPFSYQLPDEILEAYPNLDINGVAYKRSIFYLDRQSATAKYVDPNTNLLLDSETVRIEN